MVELSRVTTLSVCAVAGPPVLQAKLSCQRVEEHGTGGSRKFSIKKRTHLRFDTLNMNWTVLAPGARRIKEA